MVVEPGHAKGDAAVRGPAADLLLWLWGRRPLDGFEVFGDRSAGRGPPRGDDVLGRHVPASQVTVGENSITMTKAISCRPMNGSAPRWMSEVLTSSGLTLCR